MHMLFKCSFYNRLRETFYSLIENEILINDNIDENDLVHKLMTSNDCKIQYCFLKFICKCMKLRNELQQNHVIL